ILTGNQQEARMMYKLSWLLLGFTLALIGTAVGRAQSDVAATPEAARAQELLTQSRAAIGGEAKLSEVHSISLEGKVRRPGQEQDAPGKIKLRFVLDDKGAPGEPPHIGARHENVIIKRAPGGEETGVETAGP